MLYKLRVFVEDKSGEIHPFKDNFATESEAIRAAGEWTREPPPDMRVKSIEVALVVEERGEEKVKKLVWEWVHGEIEDHRERPPHPPEHG